MKKLQGVTMIIKQGDTIYIEVSSKVSRQEKEKIKRFYSLNNMLTVIIAN